MISGAYKSLFDCGDSEDTNAPGMTDSQANEDTCSAWKERAKQEIKDLKVDIERRRRSAAAEAEAENRKKSSADRDVEMENRWLLQKLCGEEESNRWLLARQRMMRLANRKLSEQLRESQDENRKLRESIANHELREKQHDIRHRNLKEKFGILSSVYTDVQAALID